MVAEDADRWLPTTVFNWMTMMWQEDGVMAEG
jgi:hypothetical protein